jgi:hypothetical protein
MLEKKGLTGGGRSGFLAGNDTLVTQASAEELAWIQGALDRYDVKGPDAFRKVVSARTLWNYDTRDFELWKAAFQATGSGAVTSFPRR